MGWYKNDWLQKICGKTGGGVVQKVYGTGDIISDSDSDSDSYSDNDEDIDVEINIDSGGESYSDGGSNEDNGDGWNNKIETGN